MIRVSESPSTGDASNVCQLPHRSGASTNLASLNLAAPGASPTKMLRQRCLEFL